MSEFANSDPQPRRSYGAMGFLAMSYVVVGLLGIFATFATPVPLERALAREAALDAALATNADTTALAALAPRLGESAVALKGATAADLPTRIAAERHAMRSRFQAEAEGLAFRLRLLIVVITLTATVFGLALAGALAGRGATTPRPHA